MMNRSWIGHHVLRARARIASRLSTAARAFWDEPNGGPLGQLEWAALVRRLDREDENFRS